MSIIDSIQLSGSSYDVRDKSATTVVSLTQQEYDALPSSAKTANILYNITDATAGDLTQYWTSAQTQSAITEATSGKVETSAITSAVTSASTDSEIPTAKAVYDAIPTGGTGGGKAISAGTNISVTTGETADTINCTLPITANSSVFNTISVGEGSGGGSYNTLIGANVRCDTNYGHNVFVIAKNGGNSATGSWVNGSQNVIIGCINDGYLNFNMQSFNTSNSVVIGGGGISTDKNNSVAIGYKANVSGTTKTNINNQLTIDTSNQVYIYNKDNTEMICLQDSLGGGGVDSGTVQTMIDESISGKVDTSTYTAYTAATDSALASKADTATTYTKTEVDNAITAATSTKQDTLVSGTSIKTINNESILGSGNITIQGGGGEVSSAITSGDTNAVESKAIWSAVTYDVSINETLEFDNTYAATNYPSGCNSVTFTSNDGVALPIGDYVFTSGGSEVAKLTSTVISWWPPEVGWTSSDPKLTYVVAEGNSAVTASYSELASDIDGVTVPSAFTSAYTATASGENHLWINENTYRKDEVYNKSEINVLSGIVDTKLDATAYTPTVVDLRLNSGSTNPVQNQVLYDQLEIPVETTETTLTFDSNNYSTNYPNGCKRLKIETQNTFWSQIYLTTRDEITSTYYGINWANTDGNSLTVSMSSGLTEAGATYIINGKTIELSYPTLSDIEFVYAIYLTTGEVVKAVEVNSTTTLKDQVVANTTALGGLSLIKLTESEYAALVTKDPNVLYVVIPDPS